MEVLFGQLKRELFNPENQMEDTFSLLNELRVATERNFALKKMFWKVCYQCECVSKYISCKQLEQEET